MAVLRKWGENHISKALKQVRSDCWLLGSFILRRLPYQSNTATWNDESDGSSYVLEKSSSSHLAAISHYESSYVQLVHQAGDASAVWTIGSVAFCKEMARWDVREFGGVDNQNIPEYYLQRRGSDGFSSLKSSCEEIGMDCSDLAFYHADLGPTNIIIQDKPKSGAIGVIDFEIAGYLPRDWIRTKFRLSSGMNLSESDNPTWLRAEVQKLLGKEGFRDFSSAYMSWTRR